MEKPNVILFTYSELDRKQSYLINLNAISRCLFEQNGDVKSLHVHYSNGAEADKFSGEVAITIAGLITDALSQGHPGYSLSRELW
ncbi:hypothetical protein AHMF7605_10985 [Adhaeribacter arboris]|uniref:Uncharacterized protein n=1 Tax=Adhaeribacter arboris TaxID=2072846 RepID=A0A2T2YES0_9BACT|nr:hypothetical protein [Adhaeribacter arboris]PSR54007.1 hypothetical protein AHMF7605_10985 [Adhaeribacter arboris]